jgi:hypothetical protein
MEEVVQPRNGSEFFRRDIGKAHTPACKGPLGDWFLDNHCELLMALIQADFLI